jgi:hypothetical protein
VLFRVKEVAINHASYNGYSNLSRQEHDSELSGRYTPQAATRSTWRCVTASGRVLPITDSR